jgi:hypothetical protein
VVKLLFACVTFFIHVTSVVTFVKAEWLTNRNPLTKVDAARRGNPLGDESFMPHCSSVFTLF